MSIRNSLIASVALATFAGISANAYAQTASKPVVKLCTAGEGGAYDKAGQLLKKQQGGVTIELVASNGSVDNYEKMAKGECDAAIVQGDADIWNKNYSKTPLDTSSIAQLGEETVHMICGKDVNISRLPKIRDSKLKLAVGGGAQLTWDNIKYADKSYKDVNASYMSSNDALASVSGGETDCAMVMMAVKAPTMMNTERNNGDVLKLIDTNDGDVLSLKRPDNTPMYLGMSIPSDTYKDMNRRSNISSFGGAARLVVSNKAFENRQDDRRKFVTVVTNSRKAVIDAMKPQSPQ